MLELVEEQRLRIPKSLTKVALAWVRRAVKKRAGFDINTVSPIDVVGSSYIPALFGHAEGDTFVRMHHSQVRAGGQPVGSCRGCIASTACTLAVVHLAPREQWSRGGSQTASRNEGLSRFAEVALRSYR